MEAEFRELQFAYSCTRELEIGGTLFPALGLPYWTTQVEEGKILPVDVAVGGLFLQYKVPEYLKTRRAREWHELDPDGEYYRFDVYPATLSQQHNMLRTFAKDKVGVCYASPGFHLLDDLQRFHEHREIAAHTAFIPVDGLPGNQGGKWHRIVYRLDPLQFRWCSESPAPRVMGLFGVREMVSWFVEDRERFVSLESLVERLEVLISRLDETAGFPRRGSPQRGPQEGPGEEASPQDRLSTLANRAFAHHNLILALVRLPSRLQ